MLQKDGFFRKRDEGQFRNQPIPTPNATPAPSATSASLATPSADAGLRAEPRGADDRREARLVVGPQIKLKGVEISDCDTLVVEGRIEATLDSRVLEITDNGVFQGTISVDNAEIRGRFEGELTVRKQLVLHGSAKVSGKIRYAKIKVDEGAELSGEISMLEKGAAALQVGARRANVA